jgi:CheY-like chemotaxis protein
VKIQASHGLVKFEAFVAHILVVDDDPDVLAGTSRLLAAENHTVSTADSAEAALDFLAKTPVDLAIIDVVMP